MSRRLRTFLLAVVSIGAFIVPAVADAQVVTLQGRVGSPTNPDAFEIALTRQDGSPVSQLDPGTYRIVVNDYSTMHNFHLTGPGVNQRTVVETAETVTWEVTLTEGRYVFLCDPHNTSMRGRFTVGNPPPPPPAPTRLNATVGPGFTISLRRTSGARVRSLPAGRYRIVVRDRSRMHNFKLAGPGLSRATGVRFVGTATWTVTLRRGTYRFFCVPHARRMRGSFRVT